MRRIDASGAHGFFLQRAQQLLLQAGGEFTDLVEHHGAAVGALERAGALLAGTGVGAEEFEVELLFGNAGAAYDDEGLRSPRTCLVHGMRQQLLAGAAFADDEHARIGARDHVRLRQTLFHDRAARDDVGTPFLAGIGEAGDLQRALDLVQQLLLVHRLGEEAEGAHLRGLHGIGDGAVRGEQDHLEARPAVLQFLQEADAIHRFHAQIGDDEVGAKRLAAANACAAPSMASTS